MKLSDLFYKMPKWAQQLPSFLRPTITQIRRLEEIRKEVGASQDEFQMHIAGHPENTRKAQRHMYDRLKQEKPDMPEKEVLKTILFSRLTAGGGINMDLFDLSIDDPEQCVIRIEEIVSKYPDLESLTEAIIREEDIRCPRIPPAPGYEDAVDRISQILINEQNEAGSRRAPGK